MFPISSPLEVNISLMPSHKPVKNSSKPFHISLIVSIVSLHVSTIPSQKFEKNSFNDSHASRILSFALDSPSVIFSQTCKVTSFMPSHKLIKNSFIGSQRSEEHTSELQSRFDLVCR